MSCRHDLANSTCKRCYPSTGSIEPGPEEEYEDNMEGPGAVTKEQYEAAESDQEFDGVGRGYWYCAELGKKPHYTAEELEQMGAFEEDDETRDPAKKDEANLLSSLCRDGLHRPVLDFDFPARYVPSSTKGHGHLYIDKEMSWENYQKLLNVMTEIGLLEKGYAAAALRRGATFVRPEWVKKDAPVPVPVPATPCEKLEDILS